ncbi:hypothetical protein BDW22DRAFT_1424986 [Trametopsis cervina]|nr:hypothetical protein BDW22DRAFT_1424986 [Trametopsis cervina]
MSNLERLILVQAVFEFGNNAWSEVSKLMAAHPMLARSKQHFSPTFCSTAYSRLMEEAGLESPPPSASRKAVVHRQLANIHYTKRMDEVRALLLNEEAKFRKIVGEIDEIRAGRWDDKILGKHEEQPQSPDAQLAPSAEAQENVEEEPAVAAESPSSSHADHSDEDVVDVEHTTTEQAEAMAEDVDMESVQHPSPHPEQEVPEAPPPIEDEVMEENIVAAETPSAEPPVEGVEEEHEIVPRSPSAAPVGPPEQNEGEEQDAGEAPITENKEDKPQAEAHANSSEDEDVQLEDSLDPDHASDNEAEAEIEIEGDLDAEVAVASDTEQSSKADGKRKASEALSEPQRDRKRPREDFEAVEDDEPGSSMGRGRRKPQAAPDKKFQNVITMLHSTISQHRYGNIFHHPIKKSEAPDYHDIVKRPMDLKTIKARVKDGFISNSLEFQRDIYLMFANAMMYNRPGSEIHNMAEEMMLESEIHINTFRQTEGFHRS